MVPLFLKDNDPIGVTLAVLAVLMASVLFLVGGVNRKALAGHHDRLKDVATAADAARTVDAAPADAQAEPITEEAAS